MTVALYALIPAAALLLGGAAAGLRPPGPRTRSAILHFAGGLIFAVVGVELLPDLLHEDRPLAVVAGFAAGIALMLGVRWLTRRRSEPAAGTSWGILMGVGVDLAIDGLLLGIGFAAAAAIGTMLTVALAAELFALGVTTAVAMRRGRAPGALAALAALFWVCAVGGAGTLGGLAPAPLSAVLAFGVAALLFLVTEELLVEAHETEETPLLTAVFFAGFLLFLLLGMGRHGR
jgi:ZIP family zinc transporter